MQQRAFWDRHIEQVVEAVICHDVRVAGKQSSANANMIITARVHPLNNQHIDADEHLEPTPSQLSSAVSHHPANGKSHMATLR